MPLIYAYIEKYKNYVNQNILFDAAYHVQFQKGILSLSYAGDSAARSFLRGGRDADHLHFLLGKTGSGKTNLLQLIGMKHDVRYQRKWDGEDDAYFFLYRLDDRRYYLEICGVEMRQFPAPQYPEDKTMPDSIKKREERTRRLYTVCFSIKATPHSGTVYQEFQKERMDVSEMAMVLNSYDFNAFLTPPYPDEKEDFQDFRNSAWVGRMVRPYHRTSLWHICDYIRDYIQHIEPGDSKRCVSFVLSTHNFAERYPLKLRNAVEQEYWTFYQFKQDEMLAEFDEDARKRLQKHRKKNKALSNKQMFIHDLWTDYAHYLRKWVEKILLYNAEEDIPEDRLDSSGTADVYQEFIDYYTKKEYGGDIDPSILPDGKKMTIVKRCTWLAEFIDRVENGDPHGVLWQVMDDIKDIGTVLSELDDKYFTVDTCTIPVMDMEQESYRDLFSDLFDRMEEYHQDDAGIFTEKLLPYSFTHLSTGEYQYAKILGGLKDCLMIRPVDKAGKKIPISKIILLDEPEAYMHPELARKFV